MMRLAGYTMFTFLLGAMLVLAAGAGHARSAQAATLSASATPKAQTCAAFTAWRAHPSDASLAALVTDSVHLPKSYLRADAGQLYADASSPSSKAAKYVAKDSQYLAEDCQGVTAAAATLASASLPSWAHWKTAIRGACRQGDGIVVWGGRGDGVLVCASGETEAP